MLGFRFPKRAVDHLSVNFLDKRVTLRAGPHHIVAVDGRFRICMVANIVTGVAAGANGRGDQTLFGQTPAVDGLGVVGQDAVLTDGSCLTDGRTLTMTIAAGIGNVEDVGA